MSSCECTWHTVWLTHRHTSREPWTTDGHGLVPMLLASKRLPAAYHYTEYQWPWNQMVQVYSTLLTSYTVLRPQLSGEVYCRGASILQGPFASASDDRSTPSVPKCLSLENRISLTDTFFGRLPLRGGVVEDKRRRHKRKADSTDWAVKMPVERERSMFWISCVELDILYLGS
jgi:hypothetical protein